MEVLKQSAAASQVTLGRDSKMMPMTPMGTRTFLISSPFGRFQVLISSPTGSFKYGDVAQALDHAVDACIGQFEAVEHGRAEAGFLPGGEVLGIFRLDEDALRIELFGHRFEDGVLLAG